MYSGMAWHMGKLNCKNKTPSFSEHYVIGERLWTINCVSGMGPIPHHASSNEVTDPIFTHFFFLTKSYQCECCCWFARGAFIRDRNVRRVVEIFQAFSNCIVSVIMISGRDSSAKHLHLAWHTSTPIAIPVPALLITVRRFVT